MRGCARLTVIGMVLVAALAVGWFARDDITRFLTRRAPEFAEPTEPGPEVARQVDRKVIALGQGELDEVTLNAVEVESWIRYGLEGFFPAYITDLSVELAEGQLSLWGQVAVREVPGVERLGMLALLLGDTADVQTSGSVDGLRKGIGVFTVSEVVVGKMSLPEAMRDRVMQQLKEGIDDGLAENAFWFPMPPFVSDIAVRGDRIVLRR